MKDKLTVIAGGGGFIAGNLIASLRQQGYRHIRAVDVKPLEHWYQRFDDVENLSLDLNERENCEIAMKGATEVYNLAANMGGMGFIEKNKALCMLSVLINTHMLMAARKYGVERYFYSSSACVYNGILQHTLCVLLILHNSTVANPLAAKFKLGFKKYDASGSAR